MSIQRFRWSKVYESSEEELIAFLGSRNLQAAQVVGEAGSSQAQPANPKEVTLWCAEGSLAVHTPAAKKTLQPGDALRISADTAYELHAGISGYVCYVTTRSA